MKVSKEGFVNVELPIGTYNKDEIEGPMGGNGTCGHPNATLHCTFRTHGGRIHGRASFYFDVIGERHDDLTGPGKIRINFQAFLATGGSQVFREA